MKLPLTLAVRNSCASVSRLAVAASAALVWHGAGAQMFMPTNAAVSPGGAFTYNIPISVVPVKSGVSPALSLAYNSSAGDGEVGVGWHLSGTSRITRCPQTTQHDGVRKPVSNTTSDRFCLDGKRLLAVSGAYGADKTQYRTEIDDYANVISYSDTAGVPKYFVVKSRNGQVAEYGNAADAKQLTNAGSTPVAWAMNKVSDAFGNQMIFVYTNSQSDGQHYLSRIDYGGSSKSLEAAPYSVKFDYENRDKPVVGYALGSAYSVKKRLQKITLNQGVQDNPIWRYELKYEASGSPATSRPRLSSVQQCMKASGNCYPSVKLDWYGDSMKVPAGKKNAFAADLNLWNGQFRYFTMDLNGDGLSDILALRDGLYWSFIAKKTGGFDVTQRSLPTGVSFPVAAKYRALQGDFDGDGLVDLFLAQGSNYALVKSVGDGTVTVPVVSAALPGGISYVPISTTASLDAYYQPYRWLVTDADGDGRSDILLYGPANESAPSGSSRPTANDPLYVKVLKSRAGFTFEYVSKDVGPEIKSFLAQSGGSIVNRSVSSHGFANFDGDDAQELFMSVVFGDTSVRQDGLIVFKLDASGLPVWSSLSTLGRNYPMSGVPNINAIPFRKMGSFDFNGDGVDDFSCGLPVSVGLYCPFKSDGLAFSAMGASENLVLSHDNYLTTSFNPGKVYYGDFNGDGLVDVASFDEVTSSLSVRLNKGDGTFAAAVVGSNSTPASGGASTFIQGDFDGDGVTDLIVPQNSGAMGPGYYEFFSARGPVDLLKSITMAGVKRTVTYKLMTQAHGAEYLPGTDSLSFPIRALIEPRFLVTSVETTRDGTAQQTDHHKYADARVSVGANGLGSLGFKWFQVTNQETGLVSRTYFRQDFPFVGSVDKVGRGLSEAEWSNMGLTQNYYGVKAFASSDPTYLTAQQCVDGQGDGTSKACIDALTKPGNRYTPYNSGVLNKPFDWNSTLLLPAAMPQTRVTTVIDNWGNATTVTLENLDANGSSIDRKRVTKSVFAPADVENWRLGRVLKTSVEHIAP